MKGFIYFLELAISAILIAIILITFFTVGIKQDWERSHLISIGNDIFNHLRNSGNVTKLLNNDTSDIDTIIPPNIGYTLKISGSPKPNIKVGCIDVTSYDYINDLLTDTYVNDYWVNFTVEQFDISNGVPSDYDAVVFVNYTGYSDPSVKSNITEYLNKGGVVIGINATINSNDVDFNEIFGLTSSIGTSSLLNFTNYDPNWDSIAKYFLGFGFDVNTPYGTGTWYIWETGREVSVSLGGGGFGVDIENKTVDEGLIQNIPEGGIFKLKGPDILWYTFKVKKIWSLNRVDIQPINTDFIFKDFSEKNVMGLKNILSNFENTYAGLTTNNTVIWISDFLWSDEYRTLVKAAIASKIIKWFVKKYETIQDVIIVSSFVPFCCDMPEVAELTLYLWYKV